MTEWVTPRRLTSGAPASPDLSADEAATVARFDAAPDAEESLRERVAIAMHKVDVGTWGWLETDDDTRDDYRDMADAAIAVIRGDDA